LGLESAEKKDSLDYVSIVLLRMTSKRPVKRLQQKQLEDYNAEVSGELKPASFLLTIEGKLVYTELG
jgi:hypothetical protein